MRRLLPLLAAGLLGVAPAGAQLPDDLEVGAYVEVEGALEGGSLVAEAVEVRAGADAESRVRGALDAVDAGARSLSVAGVALILAADVRPTEAGGRRLELASLAPGQLVDARGIYRDGVLRIRSVSIGGEPRRKLKLVGVIDAVDPGAGTFRLLGVGVRVNAETWIGLD